jgi:TPR repeat protein
MRRITHLLLGLILIALPLSTKLVAEAESGVDVSTLKRPEGARLSSNEQREETVVRSGIRKAERLIRDGKNEAETQDDFSRLSQETIDLSHIREAGEKKINEGELMIEKAAVKLAALYARSAERNDYIDATRKDGRLRSWTNLEGRSVEAAFVKLTGDKLTIQTPAGDEYVVPLDKLIEEDQVIARFFESGLELSDEKFLNTVETGYSSQVMKYIGVGYSPPSSVYADALSICVMKQDDGIQTLRKLIELGLDLDAYNSEGLTALSVAVKEGAVEAADYLASAGASPLVNDRTLEELNPRMWALHKGDGAMVVLLSKHGGELSDNMKGLLTLAQNGELQPLSIEMLAELREIDSGEGISSEERDSFKLKIFGLKPTITDLESVINNRDYRSLVTIYHGLDFYEHTLARNSEYINEVVAIWEDQHTAGDLGATYSLALNAINGWSAASDPSAAKLYLQEAAKKDHSPSMVLLGEFYEEGLYVEQDLYQAFAYYKNASEVGDPMGMVKLGHCYEEGIYVKKDVKKAFTWYKRATEAGSTEGMAQLGRCYMNGIGVMDDSKIGLEWYIKSANANNLSAMYYLGDYLITGQGSRSRNATTGVEWLKKAAEFGDRSALNALGEVYSNGTLKVDDKRASAYFLEAAERGELASMFAIAGRLAIGTGIDKDEVSAFNWYEKAAERGHIKATIGLAICYSSGKGVERNAAKAFKLFKQAAADDDMEAIANLAVSHARGLGTAVNEEESARLYLEVLNSGHQKAIAIVEVLSKEEE